jgi:hypothetical protein
MIYLNYEKAQGMFDSHDPVAVGVVRHVNSFMISEEMRYLNPFRPSKPFDMCYFYYSLARAVGTFLGRIVHTGLEADYKVLAFNRPDLRQEEWRTFPFVDLGLATLYISQVESDSVAGGIDFDLGFACAVACRTINSQIITDFQSAPLEFKEHAGDDFDRWLESFNS